jgi:Holliday junction resolvasome RuvABC endonuclease subunit
MRILGIDPGQSGALALYSTTSPSRILVEDMPVVAKDINAAAVTDIIRAWNPTVAVIEAVHSMPKQGVASSFKFGRSYGVVIGVVAALAIPSRFVAPTVWKKHYRLSSDKEQSRAAAINHFPQDASLFARKKDADRAEAGLLAKWLYDTMTLGDSAGYADVPGRAA